MGTKEKFNFLDVVPCRSKQVKTEWEGETIVLSFPRFRNKWIQRFLIPKGVSKEIRVALEEHGTAVWEAIDGKRTVHEILEVLGDHFQHEDAYESRVSIYLYQLQKDKFIQLTVAD